MMDIPSDITVKLDDGNVIELRRINLDGRTTVGIRLKDNDCKVDAAAEPDAREVDALVGGLKALL